jgi:hypothetical protein
MDGYSMILTGGPRMAGQPGATAGIVEEVAALVEGNALRIAGRL